jgi:beta-glucuronidase
MFHYSKFLLLSAITIFLSAVSYSQTDLIQNVKGRMTTSLNGRWQYIVDPYETGFVNYRFQERNENDPEAYWSTDIPKNKTDRKEHGYSDKYSLKVPGDWNSQEQKFLYYEGPVWYKKSFDYKKKSSTNKMYIYFGAANYQADVYLNGKKLGQHKGGFTPFNFPIPDSVLKEKNNYLVVRVDNRRKADEVPTLNTDWWNYGGITRDVLLVELPSQSITDYSIRLSKNTTNEIEGWVKKPVNDGDMASIEIPELNFKETIQLKGDSTNFSFNVPGLQLWSTEKPKLYNVIIRSGNETISDKIGFRTIEVKGKDIVLNGKPVFLRGICIHEEMPLEGRRANSKSDALLLFRWVKELNANMVRLAHYPHNENMTRVADSLGILVWSEIPVYWTIDFTSKEVYAKANQQLTEMICRDKNRASVIIWSVGNETPVNETRTNFMKNLIADAKAMDNSRIISAALETHNTNGVISITDPLAAYTDMISVNEYLGWYSGLPNTVATTKWEVNYDKPFFISETGAEALSGFHGDSLTRWSEEFQQWYYREQVKMMKNFPDNFRGLSPWILADFRSPRRNNPIYQEGWNNKGLVGHNGKKKKAFYVLKQFYDSIEKKGKP